MPFELSAEQVRACHRELAEVDRRGLLAALDHALGNFPEPVEQHRDRAHLIKLDTPALVQGLGGIVDIARVDDAVLNRRVLRVALEILRLRGARLYGFGGSGFAGLGSWLFAGSASFNFAAEGGAPMIANIFPDCSDVTSTAPGGGTNGFFVDTLGVFSLFGIGPILFCGAEELPRTIYDLKLALVSGGGAPDTVVAFLILAVDENPSAAAVERLQRMERYTIFFEFSVRCCRIIVDVPARHKVPARRGAGLVGLEDNDRLLLSEVALHR